MPKSENTQHITNSSLPDRGPYSQTTPEKDGVIRVHSLTEPVPFVFTEADTAGDTRILAKMVVEDERGRHADIRVTNKGHESGIQVYGFDISLKGVESQRVQVLLTDRYNNQVESAMLPNIEQEYTVDGRRTYDVSLGETGWDKAGKIRNGVEREAPTTSFIGGHRRFQGGSFAIQQSP